MWCVLLKLYLACSCDVMLIHVLLLRILVLLIIVKLHELDLNKSTSKVVVSLVLQARFKACLE